MFTYRRRHVDYTTKELRVQMIQALEIGIILKDIAKSLVKYISHWELQLHQAVQQSEDWQTSPSRLA